MYQCIAQTVSCYTIDLSCKCVPTCITGCIGYTIYLSCKWREVYQCITSCIGYTIFLSCKLTEDICTSVYRTLYCVTPSTCHTNGQRSVPVYHTLYCVTPSTCHTYGQRSVPTRQRRCVPMCIISCIGYTIYLSCN